MADNEKQERSVKSVGSKKPRSPNYPAVGLEEAIRRVGLLFKADGRAGAPPEAAAKHVGFSGLHGSAAVVLSALKKFGLVEEKNGRLVPTQEAIDIINFPEGHERRAQAMKKAALSPAAYRMVIDQFMELGELPSDESLRAELIADKGFTGKSVDGFVEDLKKSLIYAGLMEGNKLLLSKQGDEGLGGEPPTPPSGTLPQAGDYVQWTSAGVDMFLEPRPVRGFSADSQWAFVQGSETGVPISELTVMKQKDDQNPKPLPPTPPPNPFNKPDQPPPPAPGQMEEKKVFDEGTGEIRLPDKMSPESVEDFEYWVKGILRRLRRKAGLPTE